MEYYASICRLCESPEQTGNSWVELFSPKNEQLLPMIRACANIMIWENDGLPMRICGRCHQNLEQAYNFKMQCEVTDAKLRHEIEFLGKNGENHGLPVPPFDYSRFLMARKDTKVDVTLAAEKIFVKTEMVADEDGGQPILKEPNVESDDEFSSAKAEPELKIEVDWNPYKDEVSDSEESDDESENVLDGEEKAKPKEKTKPAEVDKMPKSHICEICGDQFDKRSNLNGHKRTVHGPKRYQCSQCSKCFSKKSRWQDHEVQHTGIRQFECPQCDKKYATQAGLKTHMEDVHTDNLPYVCDKCGKGFSSGSKLRYHYTVHIDTRDVICDICKKGFKSKFHLRIHMDCHLPPGQKRTRKQRNRNKTCVCPFCGKISNSIGVHTTHLRVHTGEKKYECHVCFRRFNSQCSQKKHILVHTGEKPYVCQYCQKAFRQKHHMDTHIRGVHTNEKPYKCKFCPRAFATLGNMRGHEKSHGEPLGAAKLDQEMQPPAVQLGVGVMDSLS
ncbi:zinc finger protein OZF-like [Ochlerotatus camptorhynchus]|uniref:zinc finger protein OZF-like n=1 Tax=Ochlerotatus camptorhynchus TaxID=644619 RepID=UPI0031D48275